MHACMCACACICVCVCMSVCVCACVCVCVCVCVSFTVKIQEIFMSISRNMDIALYGGLGGGVQSVTAGVVGL